VLPVIVPTSKPEGFTIDAFLGIDTFFWYLWNPASGETRNSFPIALAFLGHAKTEVGISELD
jgi:hypothetical protein